jgi:hypothetical protein
MPPIVAIGLGFMVTIIGASVTIAPFGTRFFNRRYIGRLILGAMAFGVAPVLTFALVIGIAGRIGANEIFLGAGIMGIAGLLSVSLKLAGAYARGGDDEDRLLRLPRFGGRAFRVAGAAVIGLTLVVAAWSWTYVRSLEPRSFWLFMAVCAATLGCGLDIFFLWGRIEVWRKGIVREPGLAGPLNWKSIEGFEWQAQSPDPLHLRVKNPMAPLAEPADVGLPVQQSVAVDSILKDYVGADR